MTVQMEREYLFIYLFIYLFTYHALLLWTGKREELTVNSLQLNKKNYTKCVIFISSHKYMY